MTPSPPGGFSEIACTQDTGSSETSTDPRRVPGMGSWADSHLPPSGTGGPRLSPRGKPGAPTAVSVLRCRCSEHRAWRKYSEAHCAVLYYFILKHVCESIQAHDWHETSVTLTRLASLQPRAQCASCTRPSRTFRNTDAQASARHRTEPTVRRPQSGNYRFSSHSLFSRRVR